MYLLLSSISTRTELYLDKTNEYISIEFLIFIAYELMVMLNKILPLYLRNVLNVLNLPSQFDDFVSVTLQPVFCHYHSNDSYTVLGITALFAFVPHTL
jgi:hypothetical protein